MTVNLRALENVARAATPGPWRVSKGPGDAVVSDNAQSSVTENRYYGGKVVGELLDHNDVAYLIAASPDVVLELIAMIRNGYHAMPGPDWTVAADVHAEIGDPE